MVQTKTLTTRKLQKEEGLREPEILQINQFTGKDTIRPNRLFILKVFRKKVEYLGL